MELIKKTPSTFTEKSNQASEALGGKAALGVAFEIEHIEQRASKGGNANTEKGISGHDEEED